MCFCGICIFYLLFHFFQGSLKNGKFKEQDLFETEIFYKIINAFTVTFNQCYVSLVNKTINFFQKIVDTLEETINIDKKSYNIQLWAKQMAVCCSISPNA